ncbi:MAG: hypothetical protein KF889_25560 [Alphaproteobacteria bacterium]|nr:hypothetical protein [Alphaproteobacteria bacterium]MCW5739637.1 hypothetical protein [Alphaproteobacteria bacterium]
MPRDIAALPVATKPSPDTLAQARERRAELFGRDLPDGDREPGLLANLATMRRRGMHPFERATLPMLRRTLAAVNRQAFKVLP